ncbi:MAG: IS3 family transposase [Bacteroidota bacterium]|nr:IS3 family transposase [Bacteroidota bacterium]MDP4227470.1 IS3 family transposase [Bacteroidota bacterium]
MHTNHPDKTIDELCGLFGKSRQAYYQQGRHIYKASVKEEVVLKLVSEKRECMPNIGGKKLYREIQKRLGQELRIGRDAFFDLLRSNGLLIKKKRYRVKTTMSKHRFRMYPNLIKNLTPNGPHQIWVSDITYIETQEGFAYLFLITDAFSRKIIGWQVSETMEADNAVKALYMALSQLPAGMKGTIHHSDRGVQYCCDKYTKVLLKNDIQISMTENSDPLENAIAERVNGILKTEWLYHVKIETKQEAKNRIEKIIRIYNTKRPHSSIDMMTPEKAHTTSGELKRHWKNRWKERYEIANQETYNLKEGSVLNKVITK